jgi:hypothetical protein
VVKQDREGVSRLIEEIKAQQKNTVWPDPLRNSANVDALLWRGSSDATRTQRIGILVFGIAFVLVGGAILLLAREHRSSIHLIVGLLFCALGARVTFNAFRRSRKG